MDRKQTKKEISKFLNRKNTGFSVLDVIAFMACIRVLLEYDKLKENWKLINFYCNWTLHTQLTQTNYGHTTWIFDLLADTFNSNWGENEKIIQDVTCAVGFETLKNSFQLYLRNLFTEEEVSDEKIILSNGFIGTIAYAVMNKLVINKKNGTGNYSCGKLNITHPTSGEDVYISKISMTSHFVDNKEIGALSIFVNPTPPKHIDENTPFQIFQINELA